MPVRSRVPLPVVHTIQDSIQITGPPLEDTLQPTAELSGLDLLRVCVAHSCNRICIDQSTLQKVEGVVLLQLIHREHIPRQEQLLNRLRWKPSLISRIVYRHHPRHTRQYRVEVIRRPQQHTHHRALPVMEVEDIRYTQHLRRFDHRTSKEPKPLRIIWIVTTRRPIKALTIE